MDEVFVGDEIRKNNIVFEMEFVDDVFDLGIVGVGAAGDDEIEIGSLSFQNIEGANEVWQVFVTAPDARVEKKIFVDVKFLESRRENFRILDGSEFRIYAMINDMDFFFRNMELFDDVFFCVFGDGDDFFGSTDSISDSERVGEAIKKGAHFAAGKERKREVVDGDEIRTAIKNRNIEMSEVDKVETLLIQKTEKTGLLFKRIVFGVDENFLDMRRWLKFVKFWIVKKKDEVVRKILDFV